MLHYQSTFHCRFISIHHPGVYFKEHCYESSIPDQSVTCPSDHRQTLIHHPFSAIININKQDCEIYHVYELDFCGRIVWDEWFLHSFVKTGQGKWEHGSGVTLVLAGRRSHGYCRGNHSHQPDGISVGDHGKGRVRSCPASSCQAQANSQPIGRKPRRSFSQ